MECRWPFLRKFNQVLLIIEFRLSFPITILIVEELRISRSQGSWGGWNGIIIAIGGLRRH
jgi:hypothetical protein